MATAKQRKRKAAKRTAHRATVRRFYNKSLMPMDWMDNINRPGPGQPGYFFDQELRSKNIIPDYVVECDHNDPGRLLSGGIIQEADWVIGIDPGVIEGDKAVACHIVKTRDPKDGVIRYALTESSDLGHTAVKLK